MCSGDIPTVRRLSGNPSQNPEFSLWQRVIAAAGGLGAGVPRHTGALHRFHTLQFGVYLRTRRVKDCEIVQGPRHRGTDPGRGHGSELQPATGNRADRIRRLAVFRGSFTLTYAGRKGALPVGRTIARGRPRWIPTALRRFSAICMNWDALQDDSPVDEETFVFGSFRLIPTQRMLLEDGKPLRLGSRALDILVTLVESAGETIRKASSWLAPGPTRSSRRTRCGSTSRRCARRSGTARRAGAT